MSLIDLNSQDDADSISTFAVVASSVAPSLNKSMISLANISSSKIAKIRSIYMTNVQTTAVTGVMLNFELRKFATHSAGTLLVPIEYDSTKTIDSNISARTGGTIVSEGSIIRRWTFSSDEHGVGAVDVESADHGLMSLIPIFAQEKYAAPIVLRQNQGIHLKQTANSTIGSFDINIVFTQE